VPKINLDQVLVDLKGGDIMEDKEPLTLAKVCSGALSVPIEEDKNLDPGKAIGRWRLAVRLHAGGEQELSPEEVTQLRARLPKIYLSAIISGQAASMLE